MKLKLLIILILFSNKINAQWSDVGGGTNDNVNTLFVDSTASLLFAGGEFDFVGGQNINKIAIWNGINWSAFGNNSIFSSGSRVNCITRFNGDIIIGGRFDSIGNVPIKNIARWNGSSWVNFGDGLDDVVHSVIEYNGFLYAGGEFEFSGSQSVRGVARWDGLQWQPIAFILGNIFSMSKYQSSLIIAGGFNIPNTNFSGIIRWNGNTMDSNLVGFNDWVLSVDCFDDTLYAVGSFTANPDNPCSYIAVYYDNDWHSIGHPVGGSNWVVSSAKFQSKLYFAGYFNNPPDLCVYNGIGFDSVGSCMGFFKKIIQYNGDLYVAGSFNEVEGLLFNNIVKYNPQYIAVNEIETSKLFEIFPNPTSSNINIISKFNSSNLKIKVYSADNKLLKVDLLNNDLHKLDLDIYDNGIYYYFIYDGNSLVKSGKIVKL